MHSKTSLQEAQYCQRPNERKPPTAVAQADLRVCLICPSDPLDGHSAAGLRARPPVNLMLEAVQGSERGREMDPTRVQEQLPSLQGHSCPLI